MKTATAYCDRKHGPSPAALFRALYTTEVKLRVFMLLIGASLLFCVATAAMWVRSYWRMDLVSWTHDTTVNTHYILLKYQITSLRGGCLLYIQHNDASGNESIADVKNYFRWHRHGFEVSSDSVQALDALNSVPWRITYRFKPTSPSQFGFQSETHRGNYKGNDYWTGSLAMPYWLPVCMFGFLPLWWLVYEGIRRLPSKPGICPGCGYDLRATPDRCPECGKVPDGAIIPK
jgi:hypothetical protein